MSSQKSCDICKCNYSNKEEIIRLDIHGNFCVNCWENLKHRIRITARDLLNKAIEKGDPYI